MRFSRVSRARARRWVGVGLVVAAAAVSFPALAAEEGDALAGVDGVALTSSPKPERREVAKPQGRYEASARPQPKPVSEQTDRRSAKAEVWVNDDGTRSVRQYLLPHYFQAEGSTVWEPIDTSVVSDDANPGWVRSKANSWTASFAPAGPSAGTERFAVDGHVIEFKPRAVNESATPVVEASTVSYSSLWQDTDVVYEVRSTGTDERLVLGSAAAPSSFVFDVKGAAPRANESGGVDLLVDGEAVASIPPLTVEAAGRPVDNASAGAVLQAVATSSSGGRLTTSVSAEWLAGLPAESFPVVIDPTVRDTKYVTSTRSYDSNNNALDGVLRVGRDGSTGLKWRSEAFVEIPNPATISPGGTQPWHMTHALMNITLGSGEFYEGGFVLLGKTTRPGSFAGVLSGVQLRAPAARGTAYDTEVTDWVAQHPGAGTWYGFVGDEAPTNESGDSFNTFQSAYVQYWYSQAPDPTYLTSPSGTISTTTPELTAAVVDTVDPDVFYDFKIGTEPNGAGIIVDSGWLPEPTWKVPPGALADGVTYYVSVRDGIASNHPWDPSSDFYVAPAAPQQIVPLTIKQRLGAGGPSPTDTVGSVPGSTSTPSGGAPSPGTSPASVTVNMVTGNLAVSANTHPLQTLSGPAGVTLNYDSTAPAGNYDSTAPAGLGPAAQGLFARYYTDNGTHTADPARLIGQRLDPSVDFSWAGSPMGGYGGFSGPNVYAEWEGTVVVPQAVGSWHFGGVVGSGGMRIYFDGSSSPYLTLAPTASPSFGAPRSWSAGSSHTIRVEYWSTGAKTGQLWALDDGVQADDPSAFVVPANWLSQRTTGLPIRWRLAANPFSGGWTRLDDLGSTAVLRSASGATAAFMRRTDGSYAPPPGVTDLLLANPSSASGIVAAGEYTLTTSDNFLYTFGRDGWVKSVQSAADDRHPAALQYTYTTIAGVAGSPVLSRITDPVTNRSVVLCYGAAVCDGGIYGTSNAPAGMLARLDYWDGPGGAASFSTLVYDSNGRLVRVKHPGNVIADFAYDTAGRLSEIRDPLANDAIAAGQRADCPAANPGTLCSTLIAYDTEGRVSTVTQPAPRAGDLRPQRTYSYIPTLKRTRVYVAGFTPSGGYASSVDYDDRGRIVKQRDSMSRLTQTVWDPNIDRPLVSIDPAGLQTTSVYDPFTQALTDEYGPAPSSCFSTTSPYTPAGTCPVTVPRTQHRYDENMRGVAEAAWSNPYLAGSPQKHSTELFTTDLVAGCAAGTIFCKQWSTPPVTPAGSGCTGCYWPYDEFAWSSRLTGTINLPQSLQLGVATTQFVYLYVDGVLELAKDAQDCDPGCQRGQESNFSFTRFLSPGPHRIRIDYLGAATGLNRLYVVRSTNAGYSPEFVPVSSLGTDYGLETTTVDPDGKTVTTSYTDTASGIGPEFGLATAVTQDPSGLALTTKTTYESPGTGKWFRKTSSVLPNGETRTYSYYCGRPGVADCTSGQTTGAIASACGVTAGEAQHGLLAQQVDPSPDGVIAGRAQQFLYDRAGRTAGRRVAPSDTIANAPWECTTFDARGRMASQSWPMLGSAMPGRTATYAYGVGGNPLKTSVSDANSIVSSVVDLLGRPIEYSDSSGWTTRYFYDVVGRPTNTAYPEAGITSTYDPNSGQLAKVELSGSSPVVATVGYDGATGRMTAVSYADNSLSVNLAIGYDGYGKQSSTSFTNAGSGTRIAGDQITRSPAGRIVTQLIETGGTSLVDPHAGNDFEYDGAGRLTRAWLIGGRGDYGYSTNPIGDNCSYTFGGKNTNRTSTTWTPTTGSATVTHACFDRADKLETTIVGGTAITAAAFDTRGRQMADGSTTYGWDSADRLMSVMSPTGGTAIYTRDALDRPIRRANGMGGAVRYAYGGFSDAPVALLNDAYALTERLVTLPGGVLLSIDTSAQKKWSFPNLQGHYITTTDSAGIRQGSVITYDPWGAEYPAGTSLNNTSSATDLDAYGANGKLTDRTGGKPLVLMGARPFSPVDGRFLTVDPVEGGCANNYVYVYGDPVNTSDLSGKGLLDSLKSVGSGIVNAVKKLPCAIRKNPVAAIGLGLGIGAIVVTGGAALGLVGAGTALKLGTILGIGGLAVGIDGARRSGYDDETAAFTTVGGAVGAGGLGLGLSGGIAGPAYAAGGSTALGVMGVAVSGAEVVRTGQRKC